MVLYRAKLDIFITAVSTSNLPRITAPRCNPIKDFYWIPSASNKSESSTYGWSFFSGGEVMLVLGLDPKVC